MLLTTRRLLFTLAALGLATTPALAEGPRTVTVNAERAKSGEVAYQACLGCHGAEADGRVGMAPALASRTFLAAASDAMLIETITKGRQGTTMIAWGQIVPPDKVKDIVAWLRHTTPSDPVVLDESPLKGNIKNGDKLFRNICSSCHGRAGGGYLESGSGTGIGREAFLSTVSNGYLRYITKNGKSGTMMRPFAEKSPVAVANLTDQEIDDVIAYIRSKAW